MGKGTQVMLWKLGLASCIIHPQCILSQDKHKPFIQRAPKTKQRASPEAQSLFGLLTGAWVTPKAAVPLGEKTLFPFAAYMKVIPPTQLASTNLPQSVYIL